jgi:hypothetical protein
LIYIIANIGENYFFSLNYSDGKITEFSTPNEMGLLPSFQKLNENIFITIGGVSGNNSAICLFDVFLKKWIIVGYLSAPRIGAYALLNDSEGMVYICGGTSNEGDNSFEIECFDIKNLGLGENLKGKIMNNQSSLLNSIVSTNQNIQIMHTPQTLNTEIKQIKVKNDFLLRKTNPLVIPLYEDDTYIIMGGNNLFQETSTCTIFYIDRELIVLSNSQLPKPFSSSSQNYFFYKNSFYFFLADNEVIRYSILENSFNLIVKDLIEAD